MENIEKMDKRLARWLEEEKTRVMKVRNENGALLPILRNSRAFEGCAKNKCAPTSWTS